MFEETIIGQSELNVLKSHGTVYICRSCKDNLNKIKLINYKAGGIHQVFTGFCASCTENMKACALCQN